MYPFFTVDACIEEHRWPMVMLVAKTSFVAYTIGIIELLPGSVNTISRGKSIRNQLAFSKNPFKV